MQRIASVCAVGICSLVGVATPASAQTSPASPDRIQQGLALIKTGCSTDTPNETTVTQGGAPGAGGIVLKRVPGAPSPGTLMLSKEESQGLIDALKRELSSGSTSMSAKQIDCMKPYVDRILEAIAPSA